MKFATVSKSFVMGLVLVLACTVFAATKAHMQLLEPATVNGTQLKAGDYKLQWEGTGPNVEVSIIQDRRVVAKVPAKVIELKSAPSSDEAIVNNNDDGSRSLAGIRFGGKQFALDLTSEGAQSGESMQSGSSK